jgi:PAS domain S-box-containing protein
MKVPTMAPSVWIIGLPRSCRRDHNAAAEPPGADIRRPAVHNDPGSHTGFGPGSMSGSELDLLKAITQAQAETLKDLESPQIFDGLLSALLELTDSEYGFIGEVLHETDDQPYLRTVAITNIAWNEETRRFYAENAPAGMEFRNLDTLFGRVITTGKPVISNEPAVDAHASGTPDGHPPLRSFLGLPFASAGKMVGMVGIANRPGGYDEAGIDFLAPFLATCGNIVYARRVRIELRETLERLRAHDATQQALLRSAVDAIIGIDEKGIIETVNPATERLFQYPESELIGRNVSMLVPEPWHGEHDEYIRRYLETGEARIIGRNRDVRGRRRDGSTFDMELSVSEARIAGRCVFTGVVRDISDRKAAESGAKRAYEQLSRSRDDLLTVLSQLSVGTLILNREQRVSYVSAIGRELLGFGDEDVVGRRWSEVMPLSEVSSRRLKNAIALPLASRPRLELNWSTDEMRDVWVDCDVQDDPRDEKGRILYLYDRSEVHNLRDTLGKVRYGQMLGESRAMLQLFQSIEKVAAGDWTVLIEGETGVGKELVAHSIHASSERKTGPFITVNSAGLSESLLASQLFGHRRGAFTGAVADQKGFFEAAAGGTLFLDEIGDLPLSMQTSLLRALEQKEVMRLGDSAARRVDVRVVAATNRSLDEEVRAGNFREDLFYRLNVARLRVPPLRERSDDVPVLMAAFLNASDGHQGRPPEVSVAAMDRLQSYAWPGNVRELKNTAEYLAIHCTGPIVQVEDLPPEIVGRKWTGTPILAAEPEPLGQVSERQQILDALAASRGNRTAAARSLGVSRATFYRRLKEFGL